MYVYRSLRICHHASSSQLQLTAGRRRGRRPGWRRGVLIGEVHLTRRFHTYLAAARHRGGYGFPAALRSSKPTSVPETGAALRDAYLTASVHHFKVEADQACTWFVANTFTQALSDFVASHRHRKRTSLSLVPLSR